MRSYRSCPGTTGFRGAVVLAVLLSLAVEQALQVPVAEAAPVMARGSFVSPPVSPADTSTLPAARFPEAPALGALAAPVEAAPLASTIG